MRLEQQWRPTIRSKLKGYKSKIILQIDYCAVSIEEVVLKCTHLLLHRQNELAKTLEPTPTLFDGEWKEFDGKRIHLDDDTSVVYQAERKELTQFIRSWKSTSKS